ncbi:MAG: STAS domain-containing protein [Aestuariibacter sp.]
MSNFRIEIEKTDDKSICKAYGFCDLHSFDRLSSAIDQLMNENSSEIVIDCAGVTYIASAGVGVLLNKEKEINENQKKLKLINVTGPVSEHLGRFMSVD